MTDAEEAITAQIPHLRRYAIALVGNRDQADDLVQDCLERAWRRFALWRPRGSLRAWLFTILYNTFISGQRSRRRSPEVAAELLPEIAVAPDQETRTELGGVVQALARLPEEQRAVLLLVVVEEMSYDEVARVLGIPKGTVMSRLHRARERLQGLTAATPALRRVK